MSEEKSNQQIFCEIAADEYQKSFGGAPSISWVPDSYDFAGIGGDAFFRSLGVANQDLGAAYAQDGINSARKGVKFIYLPRKGVRFIYLQKQMNLIH